MSNELVAVYREYIRSRVQVSIRNDAEIIVLDRIQDPIAIEIFVGELIDAVLSTKSDTFIIEDEFAVGIVTDEVRSRLRISVVNR